MPKLPLQTVEVESVQSGEPKTDLSDRLLHTSVCEGELNCPWTPLTGLTASPLTISGAWTSCLPVNTYTNNLVLNLFQFPASYIE